jgi:hypothetical protein
MILIYPSSLATSLFALHLVIRDEMFNITSVIYLKDVIIKRKQTFSMNFLNMELLFLETPRALNLIIFLPLISSLF